MNGVTARAQRGDGLERQDAVRPSAIGHHGAISWYLRKPVLQLRVRNVKRAGQMAKSKLIFRPHVQHGHQAVPDTRKQLEPGDGLHGITGAEVRGHNALDIRHVALKAITNLISGQLAEKWGRKKTLVLGWIIGVPVPFLIIWAPSWNWIVFANVLLGVNQGLAWSMTVIMKIDLVGPKSRGLAVGINEFAGYLMVGVTAFLTGWIASETGALRPDPFYLGIGYAVVGLALSILLVRDTADHVRLEASKHAKAAQISFREAFLRTSFRDRNLFAACQAGLVNNLNDGMSWVIFPLFFAARGLGIEPIGVLKAVYPGVWGILQTLTGSLSDQIGRKGLIVAGMWVQGDRVIHGRPIAWVQLVDHRERSAGGWDGDGLSDFASGDFGCGASNMACTVPQHLPLLA